MRLFSEKVVPTFTSSHLNILTVEDFNEVFFDVFEFEINGKKFIAEKVSEYKGSPVVDIPLVLEGKEFTASFVLQRGKFEILFNKDNSTFVRPVVQEAEEPIIQFEEHEDEIEDIIFEKKETILKEIQQARLSAEQYVENLKQQKLKEATKFFDNKKQVLDREINESKKGLLDEFLTLVENVKSEFYEFNEDEKSKLVSFIEESIDSLSDRLSQDIEDKNELAAKVFSEKINELATNVLSGVLLKEIDSNNKKTTSDITSRFEAITTSINKLTEQRDSRVKGEMKELLREYDDSLSGLEQANVELNDLITKSNNKALSRIGNVKTQLEESIQQVESNVERELVSVSNLVDSNIKELQAKITLKEDNIISYYDERINLVETKVTDLTEDNKQYFINLIAESKQTLLDQINNIKVDVPNIIIEKSNGKQEVDLKGIKLELEKIISARFSTELMSLKRLIEMSSGGGSVAQQFANGGTMNGNLNVTGNITASDSITVGGVNTPYVVTNSVNVSTLSATILSADRIFTTQLDALSANITVIDIKQYELSGFNVQGDATVQGSISASGNLTVDTNTFFVDATNNKVGVGTSSSLIGKLDVVGSPTTNTSTDVLVVSRPYNAGFGFHSAASFKLSNPSSSVNNTRLDIALMQGNTQTPVTPDTTVMTLLANGRVGIGTTTPSAKLHTIGTTEQLRIGYDASNYWNATTSSTGVTTLSAVGASAGIVFGNTTRPTSAGTGTPSVSSLITLTDGDTRFGSIGLANTSAISITSSITPQTIRSTALAVGVYYVRMVFSLIGTSNTGTRHGYNFSGTSTIRFFRTRTSSTPYVQVTSTPSFDQGLAESTTSAVIEGIIQVTAAGTFSMQAAQNTSHADSLSVGASNHMIITPCPNGSIS